MDITSLEIVLEVKHGAQAGLSVGPGGKLLARPGHQPEHGQVGGDDAAEEEVPGGGVPLLSSAHRKLCNSARARVTAVLQSGVAVRG